MKLLLHLYFSLLLVTSVTVTWSWPYGEEKVRGVNAGGWLVLESWMTPSLFADLPNSVVDEHSLCTYLGPIAALERLRAHWDTWITEEDFAMWAASGLNHVRLPIGYWALNIKVGEPWVPGSWEYVLKSAEWCKKYGLQLMIDLNGAPGSQNGWDHSGQSGEVGFYYSDENIERAVNVMGRIAEWANSTQWRETVSVIQVINEPVVSDDYDYRLSRLRQYYLMAYDEIRKYNDVVVMCVHDAFIDLSEWYYLGEDPHYSLVMLDTHHYQVFGDEWRDMTCTEHTFFPCTHYDRLREADAKLWTIVGEWSLATPGELNCTQQAAFCEQEIAAFEVASGWVMWAANNGQNMREWSYKHSYAEGWIKASGNVGQCQNGKK